LKKYKKNYSAIYVRAFGATSTLFYSQFFFVNTLAQRHINGEALILTKSVNFFSGKGIF